MADDKNLNIKITTSADTSGARATTQAVKETTEVVKQSTEAAKQTTEAVKRDGPVSDENAKKKEFLGLKMGELKKITRELAREFPLAGEAARLMLNPIAFAFTSAIGLFISAKERLAEWNKEMDEVAARAAESFGNMGKAIADARRAIVNSTNEILEALKSIAREEKNVADRTNESTEAIRRKEQAQIAVADAQEALALAEVDAQRKLHGLDPSRGLDDISALKREAQIKNAAEQHRDQIQNAADQAAIDPVRNHLDNQIAERNRIQAIEAPLEKNHVKRDAEITHLPDVITKLESDLKNAADAIAKQTEIVDEAKASEAGMSGDDLALHHKLYVQPDQDKLDSLKNEQRLDTAILEQAKNRLAQAELEKKNYEDAKKALKDVNDSIEALSKEAKKLSDVAAETAKNRADVTSIHQRTQSVVTAGQIIEKIQSSKDPSVFGNGAPGVVIDPATGSPIMDPRTAPGYVPPVPFRPAPAPHPEAAPEMSPQEIEARGGNKADFTKAQRAHDEAEKNAREVAAHSAAIATGIKDISKTILTGQGNILSEIQSMKREMDNLSRRQVLGATHNAQGN